MSLGISLTRTCNGPVKKGYKPANLSGLWLQLARGIPHAHPGVNLSGMARRHLEHMTPVLGCRYSLGTWTSAMVAPGCSPPWAGGRFGAASQGLCALGVGLFWAPTGCLQPFVTCLHWAAQPCLCEHSNPELLWDCSAKTQQTPAPAGCPQGNSSGFQPHEVLKHTWH